MARTTRRRFSSRSRRDSHRLPGDSSGATRRRYDDGGRRDADTAQVRRRSSPPGLYAYDPKRSTIYYCAYGWDITLTTRFFLEHDVLNSHCIAAFFTLRVPPRCAASFSVEKLALYDIIDRRQSAESSFSYFRGPPRTPPLGPTFFVASVLVLRYTGPPTPALLLLIYAFVVSPTDAAPKKNPHSTLPRLTSRLRHRTADLRSVNLIHSMTPRR